MTTYTCAYIGTCITSGSTPDETGFVNEKKVGIIAIENTIVKML
jgi:hypothetical protein